MDSNTNTNTNTTILDNSKRGALEDLTREELLRKCKGLLTIAQKAKQTKDSLTLENEELKSRLKNRCQVDDSAVQELIENLTQQKLEFITQIEALKNENGSLNEKLTLCNQENFVHLQKTSQLDSEITSYKRQITRLTDENEQLLFHLETLEKQIEEVNKISLQQQQQLLELEKTNKIDGDDNFRSKDEDSKIIELQTMLSVSLDEVNKLKSAKAVTDQKINELESSLEEKEKNVLLLQEQVTLLKDSKALELEPSDATTKLKEKLKLFHSKIVKFAGIVKVLKEDRNIILQQFKSYTEQVNDWKTQLTISSNQLIININQLETENQRLVGEISTLKEYNLNIQQLLDAHKTDDEKTEENLAQQMEALKETQGEMEIEKEKLGKLLEETVLENQELDSKIKTQDLLLDEREKEIEAIRHEAAQLKKEISDFKATITALESELEHARDTNNKLNNCAQEEIIKLSNDNKELSRINTELKEKVDEIERVKRTSQHSHCQTEGTFIPPGEIEEQLVSLKRENTELLTEMNEMNQALKERGETISKLEAHCEEIMKKLQLHEVQANKNVDNISRKDEIIKQLEHEVTSLKNSPAADLKIDSSEKDETINRLRNEIDVLREKISANQEGSFYAESENMSSSTISKMEETNRLKDLEGSWEERYGKLRNLAVKFKLKIKTMTEDLSKEKSEKEDLVEKLTGSSRTIQNLQSRCDCLEDELEKTKKESKEYVNKLETIGHDISRDKERIVSDEDLITKLQHEVSEMKNEKIATENWKKQVSFKVQTLRKELEANNLVRKDLENKVTKLQSELEIKEQHLRSEIENHKQTKNSLEQSNHECKKNSVLNLEMQDYEKTVKELSQKLEKKQELITKLKNQTDTQKATLSALREQHSLLEEELRITRKELSYSSIEITSHKKKLNELEELIARKEDKIASLTHLFETSRSENEELSTELSKVIADHQKVTGTLKNEKEHLRNHNLGLQQSLREAQEKLGLKEDELGLLQVEFENYKVRAQSVLRQNQNRDVGLEEKLSEEAALLQSKCDGLETRSTDLQKEIEVLRELKDKLSHEKEELVKKNEELSDQLMASKTDYAEFVKKHEETIQEHTETVRTLKIQSETLRQCYRDQLSEQEARHGKEISELQSRLDKAPSPSELHPVITPTMTREEGEGSESIESFTGALSYPVPLERLLGTDSNREVMVLKKQVAEQESKVLHLTALLSDTERDLAKYVQMNNLLKEEIRRQQRSVEREKHAENLEYLKNVVFKFVTLSSGDERSRLVPVLNTILKLSPEETKELLSVAKGEPSLRGWTNYLPGWSSQSKSS